MTLLRRQGMTLIEVMCVVTLLSVMTICVTAAFSQLQRAARSALTYHSAHAAARQAITAFSSDARAAATVSPSPGNGLLFDGGAISAGPIEYRHSDGRFIRIQGGVKKLICKDTAAVHFGLRPGGTPGVKAALVTLTLVYTQPARHSVLTNTFTSTTALRNWRQP